MAAEYAGLRHHGLNVDRNPLAEDATTGGPPEQSQDWPRQRPGDAAAG